MRINTNPISKELFAKYFFEVWESLSGKTDKKQPLPRYLQLLALVSFHTFIREGVEAAIYETHHGGEYDSTNIIDHPVATVITPIGMDHAKSLGPTIGNIAWHKSGIFKNGAQVFSAPQEIAGVADILRSRAADKNVDIHFVDDDETLPRDAPQLKPDVQRMNCSLALAVVRYFLDKKSSTNGPLLPSDVLNGIELFSWPGRFQLFSEGKFEWFLDGAHNEMSVCKAAEWFIDMSQKQRCALLSNSNAGLGRS